MTATLSASLGASITVNVTGLYAISYSEITSIGLYVSRNQAVLTAVPAVSERIISIGPGGIMGTRVMELFNGDVLRAVPTSTTVTATNGSYLSCVKLGLG